MIRHIVNLVLLRMPPTRWFALRRALLRLAGINMSPNARMCGGGWIYGNGEVWIGSNSWLSPGCRIYSHWSVSIKIGSDCDIGPEVCFVTGSHELGSAERRAGKGTASPIRIGDGCWIGARSLILPGIEIGSGCQIAAGSVVTRSLPPNVFAAGVPAQVKRSLD